MEKPPHVEKAAIELDKFKRRLIRAVARLLIQQKRPEDEIWKELKKETGCDCKLLWARMRALTLKKLDRLFLANDNKDAVPAPARMTLTDWLMFDLVLVHQDIDLIGQFQEQKNLTDMKDHPVLVELLEVVKLFNVQHLRGDNLAEAWSLATTHYNNRGHECSPMLLQRRWYQLRKATREKFYNFWYAYRGNTSRIAFAQRFKPTPLETDIAATYKPLVIDKFIEWDKMIELRLITMPEEFQEKMQVTSVQSKPAKRKSSIDAPDLVMIEPRIETIDLRLEQDDNAAELDKQVEEGFPVPGLVRIKQEPTDEMDEDETPPETPKKSMFEVVLESTALENLQIDSFGAEANNHENNDKKVEEDTDKEESVMPRIGSVFGNVTDTSVFANINEDRTYAIIENDVSKSVVNADDTNISNDINTGIHETITLENAEVKVDYVDENIARNNDQVIEIGSDDKDDVVNIENTQGTVRDPSLDAGENIPEDTNEISDDDDHMSGNDDSGNVLGRIDETSVVGNLIETSASGNVDKAGVFGGVAAPNIISIVKVTDTNSSGDEISTTSNNEDGTQPVTNENIPNIDVSNTQISNPTVSKTAEVMKDVEIIDNDSRPVVIIDSDEEEDIVDDLITLNDQTTVLKSIIDLPKEVETPETLEATSTEPLIVSGVEKTIEVVKKEEKFFGFEELPSGLVFADEGIEIVDKGEAYFGEDSSNESDIEGNEADEDTPKIDPKLLIYPIVYTTRLDSMGLFVTQPFDHVNDKLLLDAITKRSKPIIKETIDSNYCHENIKKVTVNDNKETIECGPNNAYSIDVNNVIVKEESLNVSETILQPDQIVPIENETENDDIVPSDDSDDSIDESLKVKRTSYLLRKPRSRRYNPIQLCKNPDFNTRLKRLSVGFFSSPRNRVLIKSCKPLTIDVSKTFESKLVSGTLYLKPADHNVKTEIEIIDDTESHSVSVVPSAMPVQSLIDNSKEADIIPMLRQCLEASKQPLDVVRMSERNTVINLPDISEIRRINQRLLTAEVTPIQVQNNQPQVPVTIVTSPITPTAPPVPGLQQTITTAETEDLRPTETRATNIIMSIDSIISRNDQIFQNIDDLRAVAPKNSTKPAGSSEIRTDLRFTDGFRPLHTVITGRPPKVVNLKRVLPWKPRQFRPEIPWLTKKYQATRIERKCDETLLTLDALNKMLRLLTDDKKPTIDPPKKKKRKDIAQQPSPQHVHRCNQSSNQVAGEKESVSSEELVIEEPVTSQELGIEEPVPFEEPVTSKDPATFLDPVTTEDPVNLKERKNKNTKLQNPRFSVKSAANSYPPVPKRSRKVDAGCEESKKAMEYCCWARQRMLQLLFCRDYTPNHGCTRRCMCCCRQLLHDYYRKRDIVQDEEVKDNELQIIKAPNAKGIASNVTLVTGGTRLSVKAKRDIVNPMHARETPAEASGTVSLRVPPLESDQIVIDLEASNTQGNTAENDLEFLNDQAVNLQRDVPRLGNEVFLSTCAVVPAPAIRGPEIPIKVGRKFVSVSTSENHNTIAGAPAEAATPTHQNTSISSDNQSKVMILNAIETPTATISSPSLIKLLPDKKSKAQNTLKTNTSVQPPITKTNFEPPKNIREKIIFLNSKQISEKPSACPLHLGKNKILLTTIKFPYNLKYFNDAKKSLEPSFKLPTGVHIILLPDATVSYRIDPSVEVTATDMTEMPEYLAAMRAHMERGAAQEQALNILNVPATPAVTAGEVVDLIDNNDGSAPNVNETDNGTSLVDNVPTNEENETVNIDGSPNVTPIAQINTGNEIEENRTDSSISTNVIPTESNQNVNQNTVIDIQENIQEPTNNEMVSASTGQLQGHPDPSNKVSADVDSSQIKSTDVQEVPAEQSEDQPIPSSQQVNAEIDLAKTSNQIESSHINEVLTEQAEAQSEISGQNTTIEVQDLPEPATQKASAEVPKEIVSEPRNPKSKNILSDLMEMSGIFDEDMTTPENGQTAVPDQGTVLPSADPPSCQGLQPMLIPGAFSFPQPPKIQSAIGELTPITSLYELKYACANKGVFFKLDMENGYLVPINVCMKGITQQAPMPRTLLRNIAPKSVIDLTEDEIPEQQSIDTSPEPSPSKRSLLLVHNSSSDDSAARPVSKPSVFTGPARPVKLFKALKPSILQRLNLNKIEKNSKNGASTILDHTRKRKQFLRKINLNADADAVKESAEFNTPVLMRPFLEKIKLKKRYLMYKDNIRADNEPVATTSRTKPRKQFATTIVSDDSSDDEPLAKIAKKMNENIAPKSVTMEFDSFSLTVAENGKILSKRQASIGEQIESELPVADIGNVTTNDDDNMDQQAPVDKQNESELPENNEEHISGDDSDSQENELLAADTASESLYVSDADNDFIDPDAPFGFDVNDSDDEDEGHCILGV